MLRVTPSLGSSATEYCFPAAANMRMERGEREPFESRIWITGVEISTGFVADKIADFSVFGVRLLVAIELRRKSEGEVECFTLSTVIGKTHCIGLNFSLIHHKKDKFLTESYYHSQGHISYV